MNPARRAAIQIGSLRYRSIPDVAAQFPDMTIKSAYALIRALGIRFTYFGREAYILEDALEEALRLVSRLGGPGFAAPGSAYRRRHAQSCRPPGDTEVYEMPPELLSDANRARALKEMAVIGKRNSTISRRQTTKIASALASRLSTPPTDAPSALPTGPAEVKDGR